MTSLIEVLSQHVKDKDIIDTDVSGWSVGAHIEHSTKVIYSVCDALLKSNPAEYKKSFNATRTAIFAVGKFPRGSAKSPKSVLPELSSSKEVLENFIEKCKLKFEKIETIDEKSNFMHPYFGMLNLKQTKKFLKMHTKHHLAIIDDILKGK